MEYEINLDNFQGPLELLYKLIKKNEIEISEISLARVTEQYLSYIREIPVIELEMASEFMVIAAELIEVKARQLLPQNNDQKKNEDDNKLVQRLKEYKLFKQLADSIQNYKNEADKQYKRVVKPENKWEEERELIIESTPSELVRIYSRVIETAADRKKEEEKINLEFIKKHNVKVEDKIEEILTVLQESNTGSTLNNLVHNKENRIEIVVTFLSLLELVKLKKINVKQNRQFSELKILQTG